MAGFVNYNDIEFLPIREDEDIKKMSESAKEAAMKYHLKEAVRFGSKFETEISILKKKVKNLGEELEYHGGRSIDLVSGLCRSEKTNAKLRKIVHDLDDELDDTKLENINLKFHTCTCSKTCVCNDTCEYCQAKVICGESEEEWCIGDIRDSD